MLFCGVSVPIYILFKIAALIFNSIEVILYIVST